MKLAVTALSEARRGAPLTTTKPYALLPVQNKALLEHLKGRITMISRDAEKDRRLLSETGLSFPVIDVEDTNAVIALLNDAVLVPGDLLFTDQSAVQPRIIITTSDGSEEAAATKALLVRLGLDLPLIEKSAMRINYPWELLDVHQRCADLVVQHRAASVTVEDDVTIRGLVTIGEGTIIKAGSYIEGPVLIGRNCEIGPMAHLRQGTYIGDGCRIGKTEIVDSVIMAGTTSKHQSYLGHSVIGHNVNIGAFTVTADYRHDAQLHMTVVDGEKVATKRKKLGVFLGDDSRTGVGTVFYPGRKLWPGLRTLPGEVVKQDKME